MFKFSFIIVLQLIIYIVLIYFFKFEFLGSFTSPLIVFTSIIVAYFLFYKKNIFENISSFKKENMSFFIAGILILLFSILLSKMLYYFEYDVFYHYAYDIPVLLPLILLFIYGYCFHLKHDGLPKYNIKYYLSCFIKAFYIPFLYGASVDVLDRFFVENYSHYTANEFINLLFLFGLAFDIVVGLSGYIVSSKIFNNEIKDVNDQWLAWLFCFICYPPLLTLYRFFTEQQDRYIWISWLEKDSFGFWIWAIVLTGTWVVYWLSTFAFGNKFSNLTWRGLVNIGPYKYCKHPAYLSKNVYWWMYTVPFFGVALKDMLYNFIALILVSSTYYMRARTEEKHLMKFPEYREYVYWIEKNSIWYRFKNYCYVFIKSFFTKKHP